MDVTEAGALVPGAYHRGARGAPSRSEVLQWVDGAEADARRIAGVPHRGAHDASRPAQRRPAARLRRRDGHDALQKGVFINRCYDELNLKEPDLIRDIHRAVREGGRRAHRDEQLRREPVKLAEYGLEAQVREINARRRAARARSGATAARWSAARSARSASASSRTARRRVDEARAIFREQVDGLLEGGVDFFILETFGDLERDPAGAPAPCATRATCRSSRR